MVYHRKGEEQILPTTSIGFTAAQLTSYVAYASVKVLSNVTYTKDVFVRLSSDAASTTGANGEHQFFPGESFEVWGDHDLRNFRAIQSASAAALQVTYFGTD